MFSKQVARQIEEAFAIVSAVTKNADEVASRLGRHFVARLAADQPQTDWKVVLDNLAQTLRETSSQLELQVRVRIEPDPVEGKAAAKRLMAQLLATYHRSFRGPHLSGAP